MGAEFKEVLIASHIVPWRNSNDDERRVDRASKISIEAMMQNIITESAVVVKFISFEEIILWFVR